MRVSVGSVLNAASTTSESFSGAAGIEASGIGLDGTAASGSKSVSGAGVGLDGHNENARDARRVEGRILHGYITLRLG